MRSEFSVIFVFLITALIACSAAAKLSKKTIGGAVAFLEAALIPPVLGNLLIVMTDSWNIAMLGRYIYFLGMDCTIYALMHFTVKYCKVTGNGQSTLKIAYVALIVDTVQLLLNPFFGHAFSQEGVIVDGRTYYKLVPYIGQAFHRIVIYGILFSIILVYIIIILRMPRIYRERYLIILLSLVIASVWQTIYVFSRSPIDRSMIGFGVIGIIIFYFSIWYRPVRLLDRMLSGIVSELSEAAFVFDPNGNCIWANEQGCQMTNVDSTNFEDAKRKLIEMFGNPGLKTNGFMTMQMIGEGENTKYYTLEEQSFSDNSRQRRSTGSYLRIRDVTESQLKLKRDMYNATHDILTGLYTREYLYQQIAELIQTHPETKYLIIFVDVKNFKIVNDVFGTEFGDYALKCIADWVAEGLTDECRYGRLAGDTFGVCMPISFFRPDAVEDQLSHFIVQKENATHQLLIHLGVYTVDMTEPSESDVSVMFDRAHLSLATIKDEYKKHIAFYDNQIREKMLWNQSISTQLNEAIRSRQVRPYLQPIADVDGTIVGAEALARWIHPEHGFLSPGLFIPAFEKNGMIIEIDKYMWRCACEILARWEAEGRDLFISVNISPKDFYFMDVVSEVKDLVAAYGINPRNLRIEITETVMMNEAESRMQVLESFRKAGFIVEMDDFGSGYSSLNMLKDMPVDVLKIDMKFLGKTDKRNKAQTIVKNIIKLSEDLGITALTEGVETENQYQILSQMGCKLFQGYYFAKPMPVEEFEQMLAQKE
ncbi:MAG: EAL domain-containing protein [Oscillospiraceae bacterium]|nr:EAL domain-containing protein [Oscillospiraceae bacterium]